MDFLKKFWRKKRQEFRRNEAGSQRITDLISENFKQDTVHVFSHLGMLRDQKFEYVAEDVEVLAKPDRAKYETVLEEVNRRGRAVTAHAMRHYCDILADSEQTKENRSKAMVDAVQLLFVIATVADKETEDLNEAVLNACARDSSIVTLQVVTNRQLMGRKRFYSPEQAQKIQEAVNERLRNA